MGIILLHVPFDEVISSSGTLNGPNVHFNIPEAFFAKCIADHLKVSVKATLVSMVHTEIVRAKK